MQFLSNGIHEFWPHPCRYEDEAERKHVLTDIYGHVNERTNEVEKERSKSHSNNDVGGKEEGVDTRCVMHIVLREASVGIQMSDGEGHANTRAAYELGKLHEARVAG